MIALIFWIVVLGLIVAAVYHYAPIPQGFKVLVYAVCIITAIWMVVNAFGVDLNLNSMPRVGASRASGTLSPVGNHR